MHLLFDDGDQANQVWDHVIIPEPPGQGDKGKSVWACVDRYAYAQGSGFRRFMHGKIVEVYDGTQPKPPSENLRDEAAASRQPQMEVCLSEGWAVCQAIKTFLVSIYELTCCNACTAYRLCAARFHSGPKGTSGRGSKSLSAPDWET